MARTSTSGTAKRIKLTKDTAGSLTQRGFHIFNSPTERTEDYKRYVVYKLDHTSLYGTRGRKEAFIHDHGREFIFEAKYQDVGGSVDEKLPYLFESFVTSTVPNWIVMFDGDYWLKEQRGCNAIAWLRDKNAAAGNCRDDGGQLYIVVGRKEWQALANQLFPNGV